MAEAAEAPTIGSALVGSIPRFIMLYAAVTAFKAFTGGAQQQAGRGGGNMRPSSGEVTSIGARGSAVPLVNGFAGIPLELRVYLTDQEAFDAFGDASALVWTEQFDLAFSGGVVAQRNHTLRASDALMRNASSVWAHIYLTPAGRSPDPRSGRYDRSLTAERHHQLVAYKRAARGRKVRSLLANADSDASEGAAGEERDGGAPAGGADGSPSGQQPPQPLVPHWKPSLSVAVCSDVTKFPSRASIPSVLLDHLLVQPPAHPPLGASSPAASVASAAPAPLGADVYLPRPFVNEVWLAESAVQPLNSSTPVLQLRLELAVVSLLKLSLLSHLGKTLEQHASTHGDSARGAAATEELRRMMTETNPYLLLLTFVVTILHSLFDFLAFRNDIKFWRGTKTMEGLSTRTLLVNVVVHSITFLYLLDNDTSNVILMSNGVGLAIELWKVHKVCNVSLSWAREQGAGELFAALPRVRFKARGDFEHSATATYDQQAAEYVAWVLLPLVVGTSLYSLCHSQHRSWYSWLLGSAVTAVYSFGFANQAPQLFINYKLKSTAHMPWRTLCYKALNTFIDDLFAFIIKMPTMHRLSCLRDDFIFVIYLYQRYAYGVDKKRANEYGQREEDDGNAIAGVASQNAAPAGDVVTTSSKTAASSSASMADASTPVGVERGVELVPGSVQVAGDHWGKQPAPSADDIDGPSSLTFAGDHQTEVMRR